MFCSGVGFNFLVVAGHHLFLTLICLIKLNYTEVQRPDFRPSQGPQNAHIGHPVSPTILKTPYSSPFKAIMQARKSASKIVASSRFSNLNLVLGKLANIRE